ncbi:hypothetical protein LG290_01320 [Halomonas sediminis]
MKAPGKWKGVDEVSSFRFGAILICVNETMLKHCLKNRSVFLAPDNVHSEVDADEVTNELMQINLLYETLLKNQKMHEKYFLIDQSFWRQRYTWVSPAKIKIALPDKAAYVDH